MLDATGLEDRPCFAFGHKQTQTAVSTITGPSSMAKHIQDVQISPLDARVPILLGMDLLTDVFTHAMDANTQEDDDSGFDIQSYSHHELEQG